jgi:hydroxymethylpyrimidine/phosphomethylpyrimidine kinase
MALSRVNPVRILTIAGSDSSGGAGIQADIRTIAALGGHGLTAITSITAQNSLGVFAQKAITDDLLTAQIDAVVADIGVDAVKIGMLPTPESAVVVADALQRHQLKNIVLDPISRASSGPALTTIETQAVIKQRLLPLVDLVTPNLDETYDYFQHAVRSRVDMLSAAQAWLAQGCRAVLVKGGHLAATELSDYFCTQQGQEEWFLHPRIETRNLRGTGCTLSTAITVQLAYGHAVSQAIRDAVQFVQQAIAAARLETLSKVSGPLRQR